MNQTIRKRYDLPDVDVQGGTIKETFELDKGTRKVTGVLVVADLDNQLYHRGGIGIRINGEEVVPDDYHAKLLMSGLGVAPSERFLPCDLEPGNGLVQVTYTDFPNPLQAYSPYKVSLYLETQFDGPA